MPRYLQLVRIRLTLVPRMTTLADIVNSTGCDVLEIQHVTKKYGRDVIAVDEVSLQLNAGVVGLYGIMAQVYPTHVRATGTGFTIGIGRAGAMLAPIIAGYLFHAGYDLEFVAVAMGVGSLVAAAALWLLPFRPEAAD